MIQSATRIVLLALCFALAFTASANAGAISAFVARMALAR